MSHEHSKSVFYIINSIVAVIFLFFACFSSEDVILSEAIQIKVENLKELLTTIEVVRFLRLFLIAHVSLLFFFRVYSFFLIERLKRTFQRRFCRPVPVIPQR